MSKRPLRATGPDGSGLPGVGVVDRDEGAGDVPSDDLEVPVASLISGKRSAEIAQKKRDLLFPSFQPDMFKRAG